MTSTSAPPKLPVAEFREANVAVKGCIQMLGERAPIE